MQIIGVHTPETTGEGDLEAVAANVQKLGIKYPVAVDNERATWDAYGNRCWPSVYLIDKQGRIRFRWDGELESERPAWRRGDSGEGARAGRREGRMIGGGNKKPRVYGRQNRPITRG